MASSIIPFPGPLKSARPAPRLVPSTIFGSASRPAAGITRHRGLHLIKSARGVVASIRPAKAGKADTQQRAREIVAQVEREQQFQALHQASRFFAMPEALPFPVFQQRETPLAVLRRVFQAMLYSLSVV